MRKIIFLLFIIFSNVMQLFGNNWYVSTTSSGNASGDSWTNSALYTSFSQGQLSAGDTVYIDGGVSSMIYRALWTITADGTAGANIIFTRGKDANHNGVPIFRQPVNSNNHTINFYDSRYVELSYIKTDTCGNGMRTINLTGGSHHIDIVHNDIVYVTGTGVQLNTASDVRIMHNNFTTGVIDNTYNNDAIWSGMTTLNLEVAYNYFLGQNTATANPNHKDFMQINGNAGVCSIHHNFFRADRSTYQSIYTENGTGTLNIYNNIIDQTGTTLPGSIFNLKSPEQGQTINVYNNVLICGTYDVIGFYTPTILNFKNNLVKISSYRMEINPYNNSFTNVNFDYNQYIIPGTYGFSNQGDNSFASWQNVSTYNYPDINSSTTGFTLVDAPSVTATNYMLTENSSGKDEGTDLSSIFTTDFRDTVRTGAWDVGSFER